MTGDFFPLPPDSPSPAIFSPPARHFAARFFRSPPSRLSLRLSSRLSSRLLRTCAAFFPANELLFFLPSFFFFLFFLFLFPPCRSCVPSRAGSAGFQQPALRCVSRSGRPFFNAGSAGSSGMALPGCSEGSRRAGVSFRAESGASLPALFGFLSKVVLESRAEGGDGYVLYQI